MTMKAESHVVMWVNTSAAAREALLDSRAGHQGKVVLADALMSAFSLHFVGGFIPDINALYLFGEQLDGAFVAVACKPRGFRRAIGQVGWAVALISERELFMLEAAEVDTRNDLLLELIDATPEQAASWGEMF